MMLLPEDNVVALIMFLIICLCALGVFLHYASLEIPAVARFRCGK